MVANALADFLPYTTSQHSVSLLLGSSVEEAVRALKHEGFQELTNVAALEKAGKYYIKTAGHTPQELYDLAVQYGSGQIRLYEKESGKTSWVNPAYGGASLVLVGSRAALKKIEASGVPLLSAVGLTLQL